jgi:hypothetical protein
LSRSRAGELWVVKQPTPRGLHCIRDSAHRSQLSPRLPNDRRAQSIAIRFQDQVPLSAGTVKPLLDNFARFPKPTSKIKDPGAVSDQGPEAADVHPAGSTIPID